MKGFASKKAYRAYKKQKRGKLLFVTAVTLFTTLSAAIFVDMQLSPMVRTAAASTASATATYVISETVCRCIDEEGVDYNDLVTFEKDSEGRITALKTDIVRMNKLKSVLGVEIYKSLSKIDEKKISIPLGTIINNGILAGKGPRIKISIRPVGAVVTNFENAFESGGINQTNHRIMINIQVSFSVIMPFRSVSETVETSVCAAETVIVGAIPEAFTNVENYGIPDGDDISGYVVDFGAHNNLD